MTQKKTRSRLHPLDALVVLLCLGVSGAFIYLFWRDLNSYSVRSDRESIAKITFKHRVAQRKFNDRVVWERISQEADLYNEDTIRTADFAQAIIRFNDGTTLNVNENTMIQIYYTDEKGIQIGVGGGDIQVDSTAGSQGVAVTLDDGSTVSMDAGSSLAVTADSGGSSSVEVKSGTAQVTTEAGATAALTFGESVSIENGRDIQRNPVTVTSPAKELRVLNVGGGTVPIRFAWKTGEPEAVTVQTSRTRDFAEVASSTVVDGGAGTELRAGGGVLYWRVFTEGTRDSPVTGRVAVEDIAPLQGVAPAAATEFRYRAELPRVGFRWTGNDFASRYRLRVSSTPDMGTVVAESEGTDSFAFVDTLAEGSYWWQVTPYYALNGTGYAGASAVYPFAVVQSGQIRPPELSAPADGARLIYRDEAAMTFLWKSELKDAEYDLRVARDADFADVVFSTTTGATRVSQDFGWGEGTYYWQVVRRSSEPDDVEPASAVRSFQVARYVPQANKLLYPPEGFSAEQAKLTGTQFLWKLSDEYSAAGARSVLQVADDPEFASLRLDRLLDGPAFDGMMLPAGTYWWRVGANVPGRATEAFTEPRAFAVLRELAAPEFRAPAAGQDVVVYGGSPVAVSWAAVEGADYYAVRVLAPGERVVAQRNDVREDFAMFTLEPGAYECRVQAVAAETDTSALRVGAAAALEFSVREPEPVEALSPADGASIPGLAALRRPTEFSWRSGRDQAASYTFVLRKAQADGTMRVVEEARGAQLSAALERLTPGTYRWQVRASTAGGIPLDSPERGFVVEDVPELPRAALSSPAADLLMGPAYLRQHRTLSFSWRAVPGATAYTFALYRREADGSLRAVYTDADTSATQASVSDLSILDVGEFVWSVTAFCYAADGYEEQRGRAATRSFRIDFAAPKKVEAVKPGRMYGE